MRSPHARALQSLREFVLHHADVVTPILFRSADLHPAKDAPDGPTFRVARKIKLGVVAIPVCLRTIDRPRFSPRTLGAQLSAERLGAIYIELFLVVYSDPIGMLGMFARQPTVAHLAGDEFRGAQERFADASPATGKVLHYISRTQAQRRELRGREELLRCF